MPPKDRPSLGGGGIFGKHMGVYRLLFFLNRFTPGNQYQKRQEALAAFKQPLSPVLVKKLIGLSGLPGPQKKASPPGSTSFGFKDRFKIRTWGLR
jgi:hypothetical protein